MNGKPLMGIINVYKEKGWTSFDVVAKMRRILGIKKIGHTGTLDPEAEGVLPICVSKATKVVDLITDKTKTYETTCILGVSTDTQDHTGTILAETEVKLSNEQVLEMLQTFVGEIEQIPPMYSALKVNGKKLYELARSGIEIERKARPIHIYSIDQVQVALPYVHFRVSCSKGTYIRTICHDLGEKLGVGGHMTKLLRTQVGPFSIVDSLKIRDIENLAEQNSIEEIITPVETVFEHLESIHVSRTFDKWLYNGNKVPMDFVIETISLAQSKYKVYDEDDRFIGIYKITNNQGDMVLRPLKLFI